MVLDPAIDAQVFQNAENPCGISNHLEGRIEAQLRHDLVGFTRILRDQVEVNVDIDSDRAGQFQCAANSGVQANFELGLKSDTAIQYVSQLSVEVVREPFAFESQPSCEVGRCDRVDVVNGCVREQPACGLGQGRAFAAGCAKQLRPKVELKGSAFDEGRHGERRPGRVGEDESLLLRVSQERRSEFAREANTHQRGKARPHESDGVSGTTRRTDLIRRFVFVGCHVDRHSRIVSSRD